MSKTQQEKQHIFREKLRAEGTDGFADGPRPWEQWDESGNQDNDRIWEGVARRIYPEQQANSSIGNRLLSGLVVVALATLVVSIAGVYLSTISTPQLADSAIHPAPLVADKPAATEDDTTADTMASLATVENLSPPAAGHSAAPAPVASTTRIDKVAVETVITEATVTTNVYTQRPSQDQPELVATIKTTPPPFTSEETAEKQDRVIPGTEEHASIEAVDEPAEAVIIAQTDVVATEPVAEEPPAMQATTPVDDEQATPAAPSTLAETAAEQTELPLDKPEVAETAASIAMNGSTAAVETTPDIPREIETTTETVVLPAELPDAKTGNWVINISSYNRKSAAERMLVVFKKKGIDAEVFTTTVNDKAMHRIRVTGFQSSRSAKAEIPAIEQTLGLEGVWVSRR
jgi:hypothetical protein